MFHWRVYMHLRLCVQPKCRIFLMMMKRPLALRGFAAPSVFLQLFFFCCRLSKTVEMGKMNNWMLHFPSHLFVELPIGNSRKWHFPDPRFQNFLGEHAPSPPRSPLMFLCICCGSIISLVQILFPLFWLW